MKDVHKNVSEVYEYFGDYWKLFIYIIYMWPMLHWPSVMSKGQGKVEHWKLGSRWSEGV
jgi:hypothetical protein